MILDKNPEILQLKFKTAIESLDKWFKSNKLLLNHSKTQFNTILPNYLNNIKVNDIVIKRSPQVKYLGIILDDNLQWETTYNETRKRLSKNYKFF